MRRLLLIAVAATCVWGADAQVDLPLIGHVFEGQTHAIRPILGIAGSSHMGDPLSFKDFAIDKAWIAPGRSYGLAVNPDGKLHRIDLSARTAAELMIDAPERVVWSPAGRSAALRYSSGRVLILSNFDSTPEPTLDVTPAQVAREIAVPDDGSSLLAVGQESSGSRLIAYTRAGEERVLLNSPRLGAPAFFFESPDAVVADTAEGKVYLLRESGELTVAGTLDEPSAVAIAPDNAYILVASKDRKRVASLRVADGSITSAECVCSPEIFERLHNNLFRVSGGSDGPAWLFDAGAASNPFSFVPQAEGTRE